MKVQSLVRRYNVTREEVHQAWLSVQAAEGCPGCDAQSIEETRADLDGQLYKIWNRLASGSYIPAPVMLVEIPKAKGGTRTLGIPTVADRIAQTVIKNRLEKVLESKFHPSSYGYRPKRSAIDAIAVCRQQCFEHKWLLEIDIKSFFDSMDHDLCMMMLAKHTDDKLTLLYVRKFLKAKGKRGEEEVERMKGTCQGGCVSPVLANLYLHEALDEWMKAEFPHIKFERYADDAVVHCVSERQAVHIKKRLIERMTLYKLELHPEKTRIVYVGTDQIRDNQGKKPARKFTFLGYDFKPRFVKGKVVFSPGIGKGASMRILEVIKKEWGLNLTFRSLEDLATKANQYIRGWINYYGHFRRSDLNQVAYKINTKLVKFLKRKCKKIQTWQHGWKVLDLIRKKAPKLFCHWYMIGNEYMNAKGLRSMCEEVCRDMKRQTKRAV